LHKKTTPNGMVSIKIFGCLIQPILYFSSDTTPSISSADPNIALGYIPSGFYFDAHEQAGVQWHLD